MSGSKMKTITLKKMGEARNRGESKTDWQRIRTEQLKGIEPAEDIDSPDATKAMEEVVAQRRVGRPLGSGKKEQVAIRFDSDVLNAFRAAGPGWQTRMNQVLKDWLHQSSAFDDDFLADRQDTPPQSRDFF